MSAYPSYNILLASRPVPESGHADDFDEGGGQHSRQFHDRQYYGFRILHLLTTTEYDSLMAIYAAGPRDVYTLTYRDSSPAVTYSVKFTQPPEIKNEQGDGDLEVEVNLRGYQD